jgi:methylmalonyl-CoA mutase N-terminal domain/subunit
MTEGARRTPSGLDVEPVYRAPDAPSDPGEFPFTRGIHPRGYREQPWMESFASGFGLPETTNAREHALQDLGHGGYAGRSSINLVFDRPSFEGFDSDHPMARHEVGEVGVIVDSVHDLRRVFDGFDLEHLNVGFIVDRSGPPIFAMHVALADQLGIERRNLRGIVTNNPLEAYFISRMKLFPPRAALRMTADLTRFAVREVPHFNTCRVNGYNLRESGATAVEEVAFALAKACAIVEECARRGVSPTDAAARMTFQFAQDSYFFEEVAKIRAGRRLWAELLRDRFEVTDERACRMKIHMQTSGASLASQAPYNNIVRIALQTLSAAFAGAQSVHICAFDEALGIPTEESVKLAIDTSKIVQHETGIADVVDPLGGSYLLEHLTDELTAHLVEELQQIDDMGGVVAAIENRYLEQRVVNSAVARQRSVERGEQTVVGVNRFVGDGPQLPVRVFRPDPADRAVAIERCRALKRDRDQQAADRAVAELRAAAADDQGEIMPRLVQAAKADVTLGEMCAALTAELGEWLEPSLFTEAI